MATSYVNIGSVCFVRRDYRKAQEYFEKAYRIYLKRLGADHPNTKNTKRWLDLTRKKLAASK